jgi:type I restriction enzyme R subunit
VPLLYERWHLLQELNQKAIDPMFQAMCDGLTTEQKAELKRKFTACDELSRQHSRLDLIAWDVARN